MNNSLFLPLPILSKIQKQTYTLQSSDGSVTFELKHNVVGRRVYAEGTADAIIFLINKIKNEKEGKVYSMINVLEEGAME